MSMLQSLSDKYNIVICISVVDTFHLEMDFIDYVHLSVLIIKCERQEQWKWLANHIISELLQNLELYVLAYNQ
jgi:hypothetical protein